MVFIVKCAIWGSVFKFVKIETMIECCHKMKRGFSQTGFGFLLKVMEVAFKLKRYIFKLHFFGFQFCNAFKVLHSLQLEVLSFIWVQVLIL